MTSFYIFNCRAYFEVTVIELPANSDFRVGVGSGTCFIQPEDKHLGDNARSWGVAGLVKKDGSVQSQFREKDVIGVTLDNSNRPELQFYKNGVLLPDAKMTVRGEVFPACSVSGGAMLEVTILLFSCSIRMAMLI